MNCKSITDFQFLFTKHNKLWLDSCCENHSSFLSDFCLIELINYAKLNPSVSHIIHNTTNTIARLTTILKFNFCQIKHFKSAFFVLFF